MPKVTKIVLSGLLVAVAVVFRQFLRVEITPALRISLSFVPYILAGWLLGPAFAAAVGIIADVLGMILFPTGIFFPGYTINEALTCIIYGFFLQDQPVNKKFFARLVLSISVVHIVVQLALNTLWLSVTTHQAFLVIMLPRVIANVIRLPIEIAVMFVFMRFIEKPVNLYLRTADDNASNL